MTITRGEFRRMTAVANSNEKRLLRLNPADVVENYNRRGFLIEHQLHRHPSFSLPQLFDLARRLRNQTYVRRGIVPKDAHFDSSFDNFRGSLTLDEAIEGLVKRQAYIAVYNPERDQHYRPIIEGMLGELAVALRGCEARFNWYSTYLFISAQESITPYHMDREMNFLLQIAGTKVVDLWDPLDERVMTPAQRDRLFLPVEDARPTYEDGLAALARRFELRPGVGVHHPFIAPHLVTAGPEVSVSLAITFRTPKCDVWRDAHYFNNQVRKLGYSPGGVGRSPVRDLLKAGVLRTAARLKHWH